MALNVQDLHIGMRVNHPRYGVGVIKALTQHTADISFDDAPRTLDPAAADLTSADPTATLNGLEMPLANLIRDTAEAVVEALGLERSNAIVEGLWREYKIDHIDMPATAERVWIAIREHQRRHSL